MDRTKLQTATIEELQKAYDTGMLPTDITQEDFTTAWNAAQERRSQAARAKMEAAGLNW